MIFYRWLRTFNVKTASHARQRIVSKKWSVDDLVVENAPFQFELKDRKGEREIRSAPWGYINDLPQNIIAQLENLQR